MLKGVAQVSSNILSRLQHQKTSQNSSPATGEGAEKKHAGMHARTTSNTIYYFFIDSFTAAVISSSESGVAKFLLS